MYVLIDYESTNGNGLKGVTCLTKQDTVIIFYSVHCNWIDKWYIDQLIKNHVRFQVCKLIKQGKNALDFYLAARVGEIIEAARRKRENECEILIVSQDKGFNVLKDYAILHDKIKVTITTGSYIHESEKRPEEKESFTIDNAEKYYIAKRRKDRKVIAEIEGTICRGR